MLNVKKLIGMLAVGFLGSYYIYNTRKAMNSKPLSPEWLEVMNRFTTKEVVDVEHQTDE